MRFDMKFINYLIKKTQNTSVLVFFSLAAIIFITCFIRFQSFGLYGDDWGAGTYLFKSTTVDALQGWIEWKGEIGNFRPLAILLPLFWYGGYYFFGLAGVFLVIWTVYIILSFFFYQILRTRMSGIAAYGAALIFALYPTNNFYLWQVTMTYPVGLIFIFLAVWFFWKDKKVISLFFLLCGALVNEATFFIFLLALLPKEKFSWQTFRAAIFRWTQPFGGALVIYSVARIIAERTGVITGGRLAHAAHVFNIWDYIAQFIKAIVVVLMSSWAFIFWKIIHNFRISHLLFGVITVIIVYCMWKLFEGERHESTLPYWYILIMGVVLICAGRYYGFYYIPSLNVLNLDSRYYFASSVGGAVFIAGLIEVLRSKGVYIQRAGLVVCAIVLLFLAVAKYEIQRDYVVAWQEAKAIWRELLYRVPALKEGEAVIITIPPHTLGKLVVANEAVGDLRQFVPQVYGAGSLGFLSTQIQASRREGVRTCIDSSPFYTGLCIPTDHVYYFAWDGRNLLPFGQVFPFEKRQRDQVFPGKLEHELFRF